MDSPYPPAASPFRTIMSGIAALLLATSYRMLPSIISDYAYIDKSGELSNPLNNIAPEEFDFIVVGSGSSGALVANRLSRHFRTLLLESGGTPFPLQNVPALAPVMVGHKELDWGYYTVPQTYSCMSSINRSTYLPGGRGLGGTSLLNFLVWNRGHPHDYNNWAKITGDNRWSFDALLPFFQQTERFYGRGNESYHGYNGELTISPSPYKPLVKYFLGAAEEMGYPIGDLNAPYDEIFNEHHFNIFNGERRSAYDAFLKPLENEWRNYLTIRKWAFATRVLIQDHQPYRAYGVEYEQEGQFHTAIARREVILSAGAIGSPKLLMLSGIGPAKHLVQVGIKPIVDLPGVGQNLNDHVSALVGPFTVENPHLQEPLTYLPSRDSGPSNVFQYLTNGRGPLTQSGSMASGFIQLDKTNDSKTIWPDTQLMLIGVPQGHDGHSILGRMFNLEPDLAQDYYSPVLNRDSFNIMAIVSRPKSRGLVELASSDPFDAPQVDPNYYSHPDDMKAMLKAISRSLELVENTKAFSYIGATLVKNPFASCQHAEYRSAEYWECFAREFTVSAYHASGTCSMGKVDDILSVVDSSLRVRGVFGLRVIDASVMPQIVTSDINAACTVIAERGADMILEEHLINSRYRYDNAK